jgi:hypothetical protein
MTSPHNNAAWNDFNDAPDQAGYDLIPARTLAKVRMTIKPGGYDDAARGWTGGYATQSENTGSVYLYCEFVVLTGTFARRKVWSMIGLHSPKGPEWAGIGRSFLRALLNSARGIQPTDNSTTAQLARRIKGFADLDGVEFVARIDIEKDQKGDKNVIKTAILADHKEYAALMVGTPRAATPIADSGATSANVAQGATPVTAPASSAPARPTWAQ